MNDQIAKAVSFKVIPLVVYKDFRKFSYNERLDYY
jgi:hypothetical protein